MVIPSYVEKMTITYTIIVSTDKYELCNAFEWYTTEYSMRYLYVFGRYIYLGNTVANAIYMRRTMGRFCVMPPNIQWLSCILIGCIFYGMV